MDATTETKTTKTIGRSTIYRSCDCGEKAHDAAAYRADDGRMIHAYKCRNCGSPILMNDGTIYQNGIFTLAAGEVSR